MNNRDADAFREARNVAFLRRLGEGWNFSPALFLFVVTPACCVSHDNMGLNAFSSDNMEGVSRSRTNAELFLLA